jgi:hypothetical protein
LEAFLSGRSAWTLNPVQPIEKPQAYRAGDVEDHLPEFDLPILDVTLFLTDLFLGLHGAPPL